MALNLLDYQHRLDTCLIRATRCTGDQSATWREIANGYRLLIDLAKFEERNSTDGALIKQL